MYDHMSFTETLLRPDQHVEGDIFHNMEGSEVFRLARVATSNRDLSNGGIMIM